MATAKNPIILGRRNCARCTRWRHTVDFKWRWQRKHYKTRTLRPPRYRTPTIDTVCKSCRRKQERERYNHLSEEEKRARGRIANKQAQIRRDKLNEQIARMNQIRAQRTPRWDDKTVDITPFRMWLLGKSRREGGAAGLSRQIGTHERNVRRWLDGYDWDQDSGHAFAYCEPKPIYSVTVGVVDKVGVALGEPDLLNRLYPFVEEDNG